MRRPTRPLLIAAIAATAALAGCGAEFKLPTENRESRAIPSDGSYQRLQTWPDMQGISDILLTQGGGTQLFLLFKAAAGRPARLVEYPLTRPEPLPFQITDLINPIAVCFGANHLFVLDQGDTASARATMPSPYDAECGGLLGFQRPIVDLSRYWRVREYDLVDGRLVSTFSDTTVASVNGIAVDPAGRVYVSGVIMYCNVDPFDSRLKSLEHQFRIYRYVHGGPDADIPDPGWERDRGYEVVQGTGIGSTFDPRGLYWDGRDGGALYFADRGNNEVQKFGEPGGSASSFKIDLGGEEQSPLVHPVDVALDRAGFIYLVDEGNTRVLRYDENAGYVQRVDIEAGTGGATLQAPLAVAADDSLVYVADPAAGEVVRYKRRK